MSEEFSKQLDICLTFLKKSTDDEKFAGLLMTTELIRVI